MRTQTIISTVISATMLIACGNQSDDTKTTQASETNTEATATPSCTFTYDAAPAEVMWIAYKYTEKTGVKGKFEAVSIMSSASGKTPAEALLGARIEIKTASSNSGDPTRDPKIKESFFGAMTNGDLITGHITKADGDEKAGTVEASIGMNGTEHIVAGKYSMTDDAIELKFELNVNDWAAQEALAALNKVCEDLHKGADGKSVLWPDVTVYVNTVLTRNCE